MSLRTFIGKHHVGVSSTLIAFASAAVALATPASAYAAISMVQTRAQTNTSNCVSPSVLSVPLLSPVTAGNLLVVTVGYKGAYSTIATPTDYMGNTFTLIRDRYVNAGSNSDRGIATFYAIANSSGYDTFVVTCPTAVLGKTESALMTIHELNGQNATNPIYDSVTAFDNSDYIVNGSGMAVAQNYMFLLDGMTVNNRTATFASGFNGVWINNAAKGSIGGTYALGTYNGSADGLGTITMSSDPNNTQWASVGVLIKP